MADTFPRTVDLPSQSPNFWVAHKDRYLRQLLIRDIEAATQRRLIVYFGDDVSDQCQIDSGDDVHLAELLNACGTAPVDMMLETIGGQTDATEKLCSLLRANKRDLRVIVPRRAKSNGTVIALAGSEIVMGMESELGPIDPSMSGVPVDFILRAPAGAIGPIQVLAAQSFQQQTKKLATHLLSTGMLQGQQQNVIDGIVDKISTRAHYHSHGSVIDADEAIALGLKVNLLKPDDDLWRRITLLRAMYQFDCRAQGFLKVFEGNHISLVVAASPPASAPSRT